MYQSLRRLPATLRRSYHDGASIVQTHLEHNDQIAVITLNNPSKLNALTQAMGEVLKEKVKEIQMLDSVRAVILTGAGKAFSAGGDLDFLMDRHRDLPDNNTRIMQDFYKKFLILRLDLEVPVIGAINGAAIGAGLCIAVGGCDVRVASAKAKMGFTFVKLGLHPGMGATHFLPQLVGPQVAADLLMTGRLIDGNEAKSLGIVSQVGDNAMDLALPIAESICQAAPVAVKTLVQTLRQKQNVGLHEAYVAEASAQAICYPTQDLKEGVLSLQEKRTPVYTGK